MNGKDNDKNKNTNTNTMAYSNNDNGAFGEISNQGSMVVDGVQDMEDIRRRLDVDTDTHYTFPGAGASNDNSVLRIDKNDIVFTVHGGRHARRLPGNPAIPVTSNCNGMYAKKTASNKVRRNPDDDGYDEEVRQALSETIRPIGQAITASVPLPAVASQEKLNVTIRAGGTGQIINTGMQVIYAGDTVCWDLFSSAEVKDKSFNKKMVRYGYSGASAKRGLKIPLKLVPLSHAHTGYEWALMSELATRGLQDSASIVQRRMVTSSGVFANAVIDFVKDMVYIATKTVADMDAKDMETNRDNGGVNNIFTNIKGRAVDPKVAALQKKAVSDLVQGIMYMVTDLDRRRLGTALSTTKPGGGLDINMKL